MKRGLVIIPAFQEADRIGHTLAGVAEFFGPGDVLVVDDGSTDGTAQIAAGAGARVVSLPHNTGKGAALSAGFELALREGYDFVITLDADGQHPPARIPDFLRASERFDLVIGSRKPFTGMPRHNWLSNRTTTLAISLMAGQPIPDSQSGYRLIRASILRNIRARTTHYQAESELLVRAAWRGFRIGHVPIEVIYAGQESHIRGFLDVPRAIGLALWLLFSR